MRIAGPTKALHCRQNPACRGGTLTVPCSPSSDGWLAGVGSADSFGLASKM